MTGEKTQSTPSIPALEGLDVHQCWTEQEVADERRRRKPPAPTLFLGRPVHDTGRSLAGLGALAAMVALGFGAWWALAFSGLVILVGLVMMSKRPPSGQPTGDLAVMTNEQLERLYELAQQVPVIRVTVAAWLAEGKTLRWRDGYACERFAERYLAKAEREATLARLRTSAAATGVDVPHA